MARLYCCFILSNSGTERGHTLHTPVSLPSNEDRAPFSFCFTIFDLHINKGDAKILVFCNRLFNSTNNEDN